MMTQTRHVPAYWRLIPGVVASACLAMFVSTAAAELAGHNQTGGVTVDSTIEPYVSQNGLSGKLSIAGSDTMRPLLTKLAAQFMVLHPSTQIAVEGVGSGAAVREFQLGISYQRRGDKVRGRGTGGSNTVELLASSRRLTEDEIQGFESNHGHRPLEVPVAMDAVAIYVQKDNPVQQLTMQQVDAIFGKDRKRGHAPVTHWGQIGVPGSLASEPIHLFGRDKRSGTRDFFKHVALKDGELNDTLIEQPGSASEIIAIAQDPQAIGYAGEGFQISAVRTVPIAPDSGQPAVLPSREAVISGAYPLGRELYLYVKKNPTGELDGVLREFLSFVNSRQGQETVARAGYYPLTGTQIARNRQELKLAKTGLAGIPAAGETDLRLAEQGRR